MKTPIELLDDMPCDIASRRAWIKWFRRWQLEAFRAGESAMRERAAKACRAIEADDVRPTDQMIGAGDCAEAIRALPLSDEVPR